MSSLAKYRGLSDTGPEAPHLPMSLVEQFKNLHPEEMKRAFEYPNISTALGTVVIEGTIVGKDVSLEPIGKRQLPRLWMESEELKQRSVALQKWEGIVTAIKGDVFFARLRDLSADTPEEEVEMSLQDVSDDDTALVELGAIFYWSIGYETTATGQRKRASIIKFRRIPDWKARDLAAVKNKAAEVRRAIGWEKQDAATQTG